jgi:hypothetical protein
MTLAEFRAEYDGIIRGNCGYTQETAEERLAAGHADLAASELITCSLPLSLGYPEDFLQRRHPFEHLFDPVIAQRGHFKLKRQPPLCG